MTERIRFSIQVEFLPHSSSSKCSFTTAFLNGDESTDWMPPGRFTEGVLGMSHLEEAPGKAQDQLKLLTLGWPGEGG